VTDPKAGTFGVVNFRKSKPISLWVGGRWHLLTKRTLSLTVTGSKDVMKEMAQVLRKRFPKLTIRLVPYEELVPWLVGSAMAGVPDDAQRPILFMGPATTVRIK
jgi:hypothetical protein